MPYLNHHNFDTVFTAVAEILDRKHLDLHPDDRAMLQEAADWMIEAKEAVASPPLREAAHELHATDEIEIDDEGAGTSRGDAGVWVQAWVWVPNDKDPEYDGEPGDDEDDIDDHDDTCAAGGGTGVCTCKEEPNQ